MLVVVRLGKGIRLMTRQSWQSICEYCGDLSGSHICDGISITKIEIVGTIGNHSVIEIF